MKDYLSKILCLMLCLALALSISACGSAKTSSFSLDDDEEWDIDEDGDIEQGEDTDEEGEDGTDASGSKSGSSKSTKSGSTKTTSGSTKTTSGNSKGTKTNNAGGSQTTISNPDSLSWNDLVAQMPSTLKGKTFTVVSWNPVTDVTDADKVVKKFEKDTGMKVKWTKKGYETYDTNITALINAGKSPDLIRYISPAPSRMMLCQDLKSATGFDFSGDIWDSRVMNAYSYKGKYYAANLRNTLNQQPTVVVYRPSLIKQYKLEDPYTLWKNGQWTYDKFKEMCRSFKSEVGHAAWMTSRTIDLLWLNDIDLISFDGTKYVNNLKNPAVISGLQEVIGNRDELCPEAQAETSKFENGTYLFYTDNIIALRRTDFHFTELKAKNDVEAVPFPTQAGKPYYTNFQEFEAYGVPKGAKYGTAAYFFLRCYANADNYDASTFFNSEKILETYKYLMSQSNYNYNVDRLITKAAGNELGDIPAMIRTGEMTADQVVTKLDSISPFFNNAVNQANDTLAKLS